jgi:hypothetical protein
MRGSKNCRLSGKTRSRDYPGRTKDDCIRQVSWLAGFRPLRIAFPENFPVAM